MIEAILVVDPVDPPCRPFPKDAWIFLAKHFVTSVRNASAPSSRSARILRGAHRLVREERKDPRGRPSGPPHQIRSGNDGEPGYCNGIEKLFLPAVRSSAGAPPDTLLLLPGRLPAGGRRIPRHRLPVGGCTRATRAASGPSSSTASASPSALDNRPLKFDELEQKIKQGSLFPRPRASSSTSTPSRWPNRSSVRRAWWTRGPGEAHHPKGEDVLVRDAEGSEKLVRPMSQVDDAIERIAVAIKAATGRSSPPPPKKMAEDL